MNKKSTFEVVIIGGSYAGLSAAMALGRSLRHVLVIDSNDPCNKRTPNSHNFLTHDGETPLAIAQKAKKKLLAYSTIAFLEDLAIDGRFLDNCFEIETLSGQTVTAKKLIFASGITDIMHDIKGFSACWGISAIHCPYCHGYEFRNQKTGIMANGERAFHLAGLVNNLTDDLTIFSQGKADFSPEERQKLKRNRVKVNESPIIEFEHSNGHLEQLHFENGQSEPFKAIYASLPIRQKSDIPIALGCEADEMGLLKVDSFQKTNIPGIFACGDNSSRMRSIAYSVATGNVAGAMVNMELVHEKF
ncbi:NAD(P)/FAD-dependent oxidoreductase [Maribacter flavus]|uniref:NAD(P)/FAD-dependent oxidoreductase n=1 Tax=Maribacter flavus TaxID=1658664 RepID=A0A5B2TVZ4_9FLAO|nr:NAD(P)/FAD-dependent oxidoreductase [Maribacter flavus]KAA2218681.1 NAD(P)/FAD-dependent oxidoreductase [Maribacter flavus]